jgi:pimeloyl-ACP methyl ester carboxylesterase
MAPILAERGMRVVAPFSRGYAPTGPAADGDYHIGALMYDALAVHRELGAPADAVLIGHDWGAFTSSAIAAYPDSPFAEHITLAVPPVGALRRTRQSVGRQLQMMPRQLRNSWYILFFQLPALPERLLPRIIPRLWRDWGPPGYPTESELDAALTALPSAAHRRAAVSYYRALVRPSRPAPRYAELNRWNFELPRAPILHLQGAQDGAMLAGYAEQVSTVLPPGSQVQTIPGVGHFLQIEQPRVVADAILDYLDSR